MQRVYALIASLFVLTVLLVGCTEQTKTAKSGPEKKKDEKKDDHGGWWCGEHGVPEEMCSLCITDEAVLKKMFKDKGDWCKIHDRAQSQCFKCDPSKYKTFEEMYVAKFNKKPERPPEEEFMK